MKNDNINLTKQFNEELISIQKAFEYHRAHLEKQISELEEQHAEWMSSDDGEKLLRLKLVSAFKKNGEAESVYSERVKSRVKELRADIQKNADEARIRLKAKLGNLETPAN